MDDDPQTLRYVRDALSSAGYACTVTGDPEQVGIILEREKPHLVLLDLLLPGTDGIGLMERFPGLSRVPVIFLSRLRPGPDYRSRPRSRGRRLHRQTFLTYGTGGQDSDGTAPAGYSGNCRAF